LQRSRARRVGRGHAADGAERSTRWIDREAKAVLPRGALDSSAQRAGANPHVAVRDIDLSDCLQTAEIDDDVAPNGAARHSTSRSSRDQRDAALTCPPYKLFDVVRIDRNGDGHRDRASDSGALRVNRAGEDVVPI
jgi:hypothetical protein